MRPIKLKQMRDGVYGYRRYGSSRKKSFFRKLKILAAVAVVFVVLVGGVAIWGAISLFNSLQLDAGPATAGLKSTAAKVEALASQPIATQACVDTALSLLSPTQWIVVPVAANLRTLKVSCFGQFSKLEEPEKANW